jgi:hypothetical protein
MDFIFRQINDVKVVFSQLLKVAEISLTHSVTSSKGSPFKLARADFGDVMSQFAAHCIL